MEKQILQWIRKNTDPQATFCDKHTVKMDIVSKILGDVKVQEDRVAHKTDCYLFAYATLDGDPTGINLVSAKHFVLVDWEHVSIMSTESLLFIIRSDKFKKEIILGNKRGWIVPRNSILSSPYVQTIERWFPVIHEDDFRK